MEDLFYNFAEHLGKLISPVLGKQIKEFLDVNLKNVSSEQYPQIENEIKKIMNKYFKSSSENEYVKISSNLFNSFVETDDENFVKSVRYFIKIYSYYQEMNLRKVFYRWKLNALKLKIKTQQNSKNNTKIASTNTSYNKINYSSNTYINQNLSAGNIRNLSSSNYI